MAEMAELARLTGMIGAEKEIRPTAGMDAMSSAVTGAGSGTGARCRRETSAAETTTAPPPTLDQHKKKILEKMWGVSRLF